MQGINGVDQDDEYFDEEDEDEYFSDEDGSFYSDDYDEEDDYYDDDAEIVDMSRRTSRYKFDSRGRKIGMRGGGGGHPRMRMAQARFRRKFCGHGKPGSEDYERAKLERSR